MIYKIIDAACWALVVIMVAAIIIGLVLGWVRSEVQLNQYQQVADWSKSRPAIKAAADKFLADDKLTQEEYSTLLHDLHQIDKTAAINSVKE